MPYASGRVYIDISSTPNDGVAIYDIQRAVSSTRPDIGGLITYGDINKWAKYKPVINPTMDTYSQLEDDNVNNRKVWKSSATWWRGLTGVNATCGLTIPAYSIGTIVGTDDIWEYTRPNGTLATQPFRFLDFNQYNNNAQRPFRLTISYTGVLDSLSAVRAELYMWPVAQLPADNLLLSDIGNFGNYYFGIVVSDGTQAYIKTNADNISTGLDQLTLAGCPLIQSAGDYDVYAVLASTAQTSWANIYNGNIWSLNCDDGYGHRVVTIVARAENVYKIAVNGLTLEDKRMCWLKRGNITASLVSGDIVGTDTQVNNMSASYSLQSVTWQAMRHSDSVIVSSGTGADAQTLPQSLPATRTGSATTFSTPFNVGTLPVLSADDYYVITYTFTYA